ncbi:MAG TPA: Yip1 family protein [Pyrinomonadaceae bacterium]|nr:Yip1 family protein [Pyrinomonadaceae bacterium]
MENQETADWQAPPPPEMIKREEPEMSEAATLGNIFFEPGRTFEDLRRKPRFVLAMVVICILTTAYAFGLYYKVGDAGVRQFAAEQIDKNPQAGSMSSEQKANAVNLQMTIGKVARYAWPILMAIILLIGGLLYWAAAKAFGGSGGFLHALSVFVYSSLPPTVVGMIANFVVLALKSADDIDFGASQRGVLHASPAALLDGKSVPVLATLLGTLDLFMIWGWVLAAIGLRITNKLSSTSAWTIVFIFMLIGLLFRVLGAFFSGNPT